LLEKGRITGREKVAWGLGPPPGIKEALNEAEPTARASVGGEKFITNDKTKTTTWRREKGDRNIIGESWRAQGDGRVKKRKSGCFNSSPTAN